MISKQFCSVVAVLSTLSLIAVNAVDIECLQDCSVSDAPTCGSDGQSYKEFKSECDMENTNCQLSRDGKKSFSVVDMAWCTSELVNLAQKVSLKDTSTECQLPVPMIYAPVCITNGKYRGTVANKWQMDVFNCFVKVSGEMSVFRILASGDCDKTET